MGEIDDKPIEPVQVALSLFGEKGDQRKNKYSTSDSENEKEMDVEGLLRDLANSKLQLEAKEAAYKQALLKIDHYQKIADEFSSLLKQSEDEREKYVEECTEARTRVDELESKIKELSDQLADTARIREQLLHVLNELKASQEELLIMETELAAARDLQLKAMTQAELMESAAGMEQDKSDMLSRHVSELNDAIFMSKLVAAEADNEKCKILSEKDAEIEAGNARAAQAEEQLDDAKRQLEMMNELEIQLLEKSTMIDLLQLELEESIELLSSSDKSSSSNMINELKQVKEEMEVKERRNSYQAFRIESLEMELSQLKLELKNENEETDNLESNSEVIPDEATESVITSTEVENLSRDIEIRQADESEKGATKQKKDENDAYVVIPAEEYDLLIKKAAKADDQTSMALVAEYPFQSESKHELETLKNDLEVAMVKIRELRNRAEQAATRADQAEKAKARLEDQIRRYNEHKRRKKAAFVAGNKEVSELPNNKPLNFPTLEKIPATYRPLSKVLDMKF